MIINEKNFAQLNLFLAPKTIKSIIPKTIVNGKILIKQVSKKTSFTEKNPCPSPSNK